MSKLRDWIYNLFSGGASGEWKLQEERRSQRRQRLRDGFAADHASIMSQPVIVPDSTPADVCSGGDGSANSCGCGSDGGGN